MSRLRREAETETERETNREVDQILYRIDNPRSKLLTAVAAVLSAGVILLGLLMIWLAVAGLIR